LRLIVKLLQLPEQTPIGLETKGTEMNAQERIVKAMRFLASEHLAAVGDEVPDTADQMLDALGLLSECLHLHTARPNDTQWILIEDELPPEDIRVLVFSPCYGEGSEMRFRTLNGGFVKMLTGATHWAYLTGPE